MQEELEMFIKYAVSSLSKLHLLLFFHRNRSLLDTVDGITKKTGLEKEEAKEALMDLLLSDIVSRYSRRGEIFWFYNPSQEKEALVEEIVSLYNSPRGKELILNALVMNSYDYNSFAQYRNHRNLEIGA